MLVTFTGVGVAGAAAYVALSTLLVTLGIAAWVASLVSYAVLIPVIYLAQRNFTFRSRVQHRSSFPKYFATQLLGLALAGVVPFFVVEDGRSSAILAFVLVVFLVPALTFILLRFWTFSS